MRKPTRSVLPITATTKVEDKIQEGVKEFKKSNLWLSSPATVINISDYESIQCVDVQTLVEEEYEDGRVLPVLTIKKVFVKLQEGGGFKIKLPIQVGDYVTLHYTHKNLSLFLDGDGTRVQQSRNFIQAPRDCYAIHGFGTRRTHQEPSQEDLIIEGEGQKITLKKNGDIEIEGQDCTKTLKNITTVADSTTLTSPDNTVNGPLVVTDKLTAGSSELGDPISTNGQQGWSGTFIEHTGKTVTVANGLIISVV